MGNATTSRDSSGTISAYTGSRVSEHRSTSKKVLNIMKILYIDEVLPKNNRDAGSVEVINYLSQLSMRNFKITFLSYFKKLAEQHHELQRLSEQFPAIYFSDLNNFGSRLTEDHFYEIIFFSRISTFAALSKRFKSLMPSSKQVYLTVDLHHLRLFAQAQTIKSEIINRKAMEIEEMEIAAVESADATVVVSLRESVYLHNKVSSKSVFWIPLLRAVPGRVGNYYSRESTCIFIGNFAHPPNVDTVAYLVGDLWPQIFARTGVKLLIVGSNMPSSWISQADDSIEFLGFIADLGEVFSRVLCSIAPLRFGAGEKGKILTSLGYGVPVLGSSIANDGMFDSQDRCFIECSNADEYVAALNLLSSDADNWELTSNAALYWANSRSDKLLSWYLDCLIDFLSKDFDSKRNVEQNVTLWMLTTGSKVRQSRNAKFLEQFANQEPRTQFLIANIGEPHLDKAQRSPNVNEYLVPHWDMNTRVRFLLNITCTDYIRFFSDDDPITTYFANAGNEIFAPSCATQVTTYFTETIFISETGITTGIAPGTSVDKRNAYQYFINSKISKAAFYGGVFPKRIVQTWNDFHFRRRVPFTYSDWLLSFLSFYSGNVEFLPVNRGYYPNIYCEENWSSPTRSLESVAKSLRLNEFPSWAIIFENIFWALDLISLASFAKRSSLPGDSHILDIAIANQLQRFKTDLDARISFFKRSNETRENDLDRVYSSAIKLSGPPISVGGLSNGIISVANLFGDPLSSKAAAYVDVSNLLKE
jgi:hypothetical protein